MSVRDGDAIAYVGVGSNVDPETHVPAAVFELADQVTLVGVSTFYRTPALGAPGAPDFYNGVLAVRTGLDADELRQILGRVEASRGRERTLDKFAPRVMDLDLLLIDGPRQGGSPLHPDVEERCFVAMPLLEFAPALQLPDGRSLAELVKVFTAPVGAPLPALTARLRELVIGASGTGSDGASPGRDRGG